MNLVLLHPLPLDPSIWPGELSAFAPTLYRLGETIQDWAAAVLDLAPSGPLVLVGNSVGGSCDIEMAYLAPERVRLLTLIGTKAGHRPKPAFRDEVVRLLSEEGMDAAWSRYWEPLFAPQVDPETVERARAVAGAQPIEDVIRGVNVFHTRPDRSGFLADLDRPVLVVNGDFDRPDRGAELAAGLRRATFRLVPDSGHYVPLEAPNVLLDIVRQALLAVDTGSRSAVEVPSPGTRGSGIGQIRTPEAPPVAGQMLDTGVEQDLGGPGGVAEAVPD